MFQRGITAQDVHLVLQGGETIEEYADDRPYPAKLVLGWSGSRPLHVVVAENIDSGETVVITVKNLTRSNGTRTTGENDHDVRNL